MDVICGLSRTAQNRWGVAQLAERLAVNQEVGGSSPPAPVEERGCPTKTYGLVELFSSGPTQTIASRLHPARVQENAAPCHGPASTAASVVAPSAC